MSSKRLENAVLITGGGQRIGAYLVRQFLSQTDFPVVFTYRTPRSEVEELIALGAIAIPVDFSDSKNLPGLVEEVKTHVKSLRALIHNASVWLSDAQAPALSAEYADLFKVHVEVPSYLNEHLHPLLLASSSRHKDIISLSDYSVSRVADSHIAYLASKAALQTLSQGFAKKFAPDIKVNDIAPALIQFNKGDSDVYKQKRLAQAALPIEPGAIVVWQAVEYLMNSSYTTGTILQLDGGRHLL
ncbi:dihydromonapterin reductase [Thiomicrorhabdus immobilis]|uniref:Dihydromonapterin reductase n=1 Tax=Thiomicrorhabdus immobilis TaxID=2791037 RepID=A0ABN6D1Z9_9GAMM|nr:dihydromonapterin reductase [Thiomicrorhabdus immobilis]BCN94152.1 dihydromonapterin reductase [Thiomicrorhabdus immobilis]